MKAKCECGCEFFAEFTRCVCPNCGKDIKLISAYVDFNDYRVIMDEALERIKQSVIKHGTWDNYCEIRIHKAISGEFNEYRQAVIDENVIGKHGQIDELVDLVVTAVKGIRRLQCLQ